MAEIIHNKLVRDKIPQIIEGDGMVAITEVMEDDETYKENLRRKLVEEAQEATKAGPEHILEELGDVRTVLEALLKVYGFTWEQLEEQQKTKDEARGAFDKRIFLVSTRSNDDTTE